MKALIVGAGAHGRVVLDILRSQGHASIAFIDDDEQLWGQNVNGIPVEGNLDYALGQTPGNFKMVVALGNPNLRLAIAKKLKEHSIPLLNAIHPSAVITPSTTIGSGNMIGANTVINSNARIGDNVVINDGAIIEHDCVLADGVNVSPSVSLCGRVTVGEATFISVGASVVPRVSIGAGVVVGAGSLITKDVPDRVMVVGTPARICWKVDDTFDWQKLL